MGEGDGILNVLPPRVKLSRGRPSFELFSTSKIFIPVRIGDLMGGNCHLLEEIFHLLVFLGGDVPILLATPSYKVLLSWEGMVP